MTYLLAKIMPRQAVPKLRLSADDKPFRQNPQGFYEVVNNNLTKLQKYREVIV
jgi:hypothetical protein